MKLPFVFTGGLGMEPAKIGMATALLGIMGIFMQLALYPRLSAALGIVHSWRWSLSSFPVGYMSIPYLAVVVRRTSPQPAEADGDNTKSLGLYAWMAMALFLGIHVLGRTFSIPGQTILLNNCTPHPSVLGTVHGLGQSVNSLARTLGPMIGGFVYGIGLRAGCVGLVWWIMAAIALTGLFLSFRIREGTGHEVILDRDGKWTNTRVKDGVTPRRRRCP